MKDLIQFKPKGDIQFDGEIAAGIKHTSSSGYEVFSGIFQTAQVILPGHVTDINYPDMETEDRFLFSICNICTKAWFLYQNR